MWINAYDFIFILNTSLPKIFFVALSANFQIIFETEVDFVEYYSIINCMTKLLFYADSTFFLYKFYNVFRNAKIYTNIHPSHKCKKKIKKKICLSVGSSNPPPQKKKCISMQKILIIIFRKNLYEISAHFTNTNIVKIIVTIIILYKINISF